MAIAEFRDVTRVYANGDHEQKALDGIDMSLEEGEFIVVLGPSGAGKSTHHTADPPGLRPRCQVSLP